MSQQTVDPKASEPENGQTGLSGDPKQQPAVVKKTPLRDLPNENNVVVSKSTVNSMISKEGDTDGAKAVGSKRPCPDSPANPSHHQSPGGNSVNGHLVYVRRKAETEAGKNNSTEETMPEMPDNSANSSQPMPVVTQPQQVIPEEKPQLKESIVPCLPASAPIPPAASMDASGKPSVPLSDGKSINKPVPSESHSHPVTPDVPSSERKRMNDQNWEERYVQLQMFLKKLEHSSLEEYLEKLRALPAAELSRHAVELENRTIQLSLDEGYELKRVKTLDVLGKSKTSKPATVQPEPPQS